MLISPELPIIPVNPLLTVGSGLADSHGAATSPTAQRAEAAAVILQSAAEWMQENGPENISVSITSLGRELSSYVLNNFNIVTELTQLPQTGTPPQGSLLDATGVLVPNAAVTAEALPATDTWNGSYPMNSVSENGTLTVTAQRQNGTAFQSIISDYRLSSFSAGDTLTLPFQGSEGTSFQLTVTVPAGGTAQLAKLLSSMTLTLSGGETQQPAVYTTFATFPGTNAVPLSSDTGAVQLANGVTVYLSELLPSDVVVSNANQGQSVASGETSVLNPATTRVLLHSADRIEIGTGSLIPIFEPEGSPVFASVTLANVSAGSPLIAAGSGTSLELLFNGTGDTMTFTILAGNEEYTATLIPPQVSNFLNTNIPIPLVFANASGLPDTITLSMVLATIIGQDTKRTQLTQQQMPPAWEPDAATLGLAGSASVPIPKNPKLRRTPSRKLLGKITLAASVLSLNPISTYLGGVTALMGTMAEAENDDDAIEDEPDYIHDIATARERAQYLHQAMLRYGAAPPVNGHIQPQHIFSLINL